LLYTVASVEQHLRPHASGCTPAILKNEGMPEVSRGLLPEVVLARHRDRLTV
jgi:hypothetical protein